MERYPGVRYHRHEAPVTVQNENEEQQLGKGWAEHPKDATGADPLTPEQIAFAASLRERDRLADIARRQGR